MPSQDIPHKSMYHDELTMKKVLFEFGETLLEIKQWSRPAYNFDYQKSTFEIKISISWNI